MRGWIFTGCVLAASGCGGAVPSGGGGSSSTGEPTDETTTTMVATTEPGPEATSSSSSGPDVDPTTRGETSGSPVIFDVGVSDTTGLDTTTGVEPMFDCTDIPELPVAAAMVRQVVGAEDLEFDGLGNLVLAQRGVNALFLYPKEGGQVLVHPDINLNSTAGTAVLPDGELVVADEFASRVGRIIPGDDNDPPQLAHIAYAGSVGGCNGLVTGKDGMLYCASYWNNDFSSGIARIDPSTDEATMLIPQTGLDGLTFAQDEAYLYFNEGEFFGGGNGHLFRAPFVDGEFGDVEDLGTPLAGLGGTLDGMVSDVCGNVYIAVSGLNSAQCSGSGAVRVTPENDVEIAACIGNNSFTPGVAFGSGVGGWDADVLYVIDWVGAVWEVPVGVPGERLPHL